MTTSRPAARGLAPHPAKTGTLIVKLKGQTYKTAGQIITWDEVEMLRPVAERTCKKCKNKSLRQVRLPGDDEDKAFCKYCGTTEEI